MKKSKIKDFFMKFFVINFLVRVSRANHARKVEDGEFDYKIQEKTRRAAMKEFQNEQYFISEFREVVQQLRTGISTSITFKVKPDSYPSLRHELFDLCDDNKLKVKEKYSFLLIEQLERYTYKVSLRELGSMEDIS